jgi:hypothetical protein
MFHGGSVSVQWFSVIAAEVFSRRTLREADSTAAMTERRRGDTCFAEPAKNLKVLHVERWFVGLFMSDARGREKNPLDSAFEG